LFFFSSRRRHTRSKRDWSSDVCSSDLVKSAQANLDSATAANSNAQANLTSAQGELNSATSAAQPQQSKVDQAQSNVNSATAANSTAQTNLTSAQQAAQSATPENIQKTQNDIASQEDQIKDDQQADSPPQQAANQANTDVKTAQDTQTQAQQDVNAKQSTVNDAQKSFDTAKAALNGDSSKVDQALADAKAKVQEDQNTISQKDNDLTNAQ